MRRLRVYMIIGALFTIVVGSIAHFLYDLSGNNVLIGLITPVNESIWEHMKLVFFPMLIYTLLISYKIKNQYPSSIAALCIGNIIGTILVPILFYLYIAIIGKDLLPLDLICFIASIVIGFIVAYKLSTLDKLYKYRNLIYVIIAIIIGCFLIFTYYPPNLTIFSDADAKELSK